MRSITSSTAAFWNVDLPKSIPMTGPLIFLSPSSELYLTKDDEKGLRRSGDRVAEDVARGSYGKGQWT